MRRSLLVAAVALVASLVAGELIVRHALEERPWKFFGPAAEELGLPVMHEPHEEIGWINVPGVYRFPLGYLTRDPERGELTVTIGPDGMRASAPADAAADGVPVAFAGCSYTFGWAVEDGDTFVWKVQERLPEIRALNMGTGGYGSYQSLLRLERYLARDEGPRPALVVYGLISGHAERDVLTYAWQRAMSAGGTEPVPVPRADLEDGRLVRHAPEAYPVWPLATRSALVAWAGDRYARWRAQDRADGMVEVHAAVVVEMDRVLREAGARLLVVLLESTPDREAVYRRAFEEAGVDWVSCMDPRSNDPEYRVPVDRHPNAKLHAIWGRCIAEAVRERLAEHP